MSNPDFGPETEANAAKQDNREFLEQIYEITAKIPSGKVATYGQISMLAGRQYGARLVGYAMRNAPAEREIPCHRVVSHNGRLAFGTQHELLKREGVTFKDNGCVDLKRHIWNGN